MSAAITMPLFVTQYQPPWKGTSALMVKFIGNANSTGRDSRSKAKPFKALSLLPLLTLLLLAPSLRAITCLGPPSPDKVLLYENVLKILGLSDPCKVKDLNITVIFDNTTVTRAFTYTVSTVNAIITLPKLTPITITIKYSNYANKTGSLHWTISYLPYTTYTLVYKTSTVSGTAVGYVVLVNPPPEKPLLPKDLGDPNNQTSILILGILLASLVGLVRFIRSR